MTGKDRWLELASVRRARLAHWLEAVGSRARAEQVEPLLAEQADFVALGKRWNDLGPDEHAAAGEQLEEIFRRVAYATRPYCQRCGVCCDGAGPTLYPGDERLLRDGVLSRSQLVTLRAGEMVFSRWHGRPIVLDQECVRISALGSKGCSLFDPKRQGCTIYDNRPSQCRSQKCWDTSAADELAGTPGLTRRQLLGESTAASEHIERHDQRLDVIRLRALASRARVGDEDAQAELDELQAEDRRLRAQLVEDGTATAAELPFLLGAPCDQLLARFADEPE
ncbi:MAG: YkgJ family cysteine cluster protein [Deltaproteobacteria bacterium]|nr:YkgJ family cysteine cluster protein [Deltaproteobacteria bacterium]